jgi:hypothetical protein
MKEVLRVKLEFWKVLVGIYVNKESWEGFCVKRYGHNWNFSEDQG